MLKTNDIGNICHEHLEYYTYDSLKYLFEKNGLKIFRIEENDINGGSYRIFCKKSISRSIVYKEKTSLSEIKKFIQHVELNKKKCLTFLTSAAKKRLKVFIYGASTKGNTLLQYYRINHKLIKFDHPYMKNKQQLKKHKFFKCNDGYFFCIYYCRHLAWTFLAFRYSWSLAWSRSNNKSFI